MRADVHRVVEGCEDCNHIKGSRTLAHKAFRGLNIVDPDYSTTWTPKRCREATSSAWWTVSAGT